MERLARNEAQVKLSAMDSMNEENHTELYRALSRSKTLLLFVESKFLELQLPHSRCQFWMALCNNKHLMSLDLSWNRLTGECLVMLGKMLSTSITLQTLDLTSCLLDVALRDDGIQRISSSLAMNNTLVKLYLGRNELEDQHVEMLCNGALRTNCKLQVLSLFRNNVTNRGVQHLVNLLHKYNNRTLFQVDLVLNPNVSRRANVQLECALETNLCGQAMLVLCTARQVKRVAMHSALRRFPQDFTRLVSHMLTSFPNHYTFTSDDEEEDNSEFGDRFDVSSFDHDDCRRDFEETGMMENQ